MASTASQNPSPATKLSPQQQRLLLAALNSNKPNANAHAMSSMTAADFNMNPLAFPDNGLQDPGSGSLGLEESPFVDYDFDFDPDASFDFDYPAADAAGAMIGDIPSDTPNRESEIHDKRSHPDDADDETGGGKRQESEKPAAKKPGRKPLTTEPTSKRKAQNRAAQRAFRERKEKHLKDLEDKVKDLEKASETANHENSILRAQIEKMSIELREYKKRVAMSAGLARPGAPNAVAGRGNGFSTGLINTPNDISFSFDFPKFGQLPGPPVLADKSPVNRTSSGSPGDRAGVSPLTKTNSISSINGSKPTPTSQTSDYDIATFSSLFTPPSDGLGHDNFDFLSHKGSTASRATDSSFSFNTSGLNTSYNSPSSSSNSNGGPSSSCGTSPEPANQSPSGGKSLDNTLGTIGEECGATTEGELTFCEKLNMACGNPNNPVPRTKSKSSASGLAQSTDAFDVNNLDWLAQQNGGQFDPQLFNDYREPQDSILQGTFDDSFFADAIDIPDFTTPYAAAPSPATTKKDLLQRIDEKQNDDDEEVPADDESQMLTCNKIWDRLQNCPKVQTGEFDLDGLCSQLQTKAKCSETGAVVNEKDFTAIMSQFNCDATTKGVQQQQQKKQTV